MGPLFYMEEFTASDFIVQRTAEKKIACEYQEIRHVDWNDNYELNRNKVKINKLTQRQTVNIPLMKETIKTILSKIDDLPAIEWRDIDGDEMKEILVQEMWNDDMDRLNFQGIDIQDKKTVLLYGRAFKKLNYGPLGMEVTAQDVFDVVIDPLTNPLDIETARFVIHQNIFRSIREVIANPEFTKEGKSKLKTYLTTTKGIIQSSNNKEQMDKKNERLKSMGVESNQFDMFAAGDTVINITEHICEVWNDKNEEFERRIVVYADDMVELYNETLMECIGVNFYPYVTWGDDIETNDFWSDSVADLVRTPNKVINVWYSQMLENRTLSNFGMHWYDQTNESYQPTEYEPGQGVMLPAPGDPNKTIMPVQISGLDETMNAINFLTNVVERATAATSIEKGSQEGPRTTLGEVEILVGKAMERTQSMALFYRRSWLELAMKWMGLMQANQSGKRKLYKKSSNGKIWPKTIYPKDWKSVSGFKAYASSSSEQEQEKTKGIQRLMFVKSMFPNNMALSRISQKRALELVDLSPAELREVEEEEKKLQSQPQLAQQSQLQAGQPVEPQPDPTIEQVQQRINEFDKVNQ